MLIGTARRSTRGLVPVTRVGTDWLRLRDGSLRAVLECPTLAFGIKGEAEQRAVIDGWAALLNSLAHPLQVVIRARRLAPETLAPPADHQAERYQALRGSYQRLIDDLAGQRRVLDRRLFVVVPTDRAPGRRPSNEGEAVALLDQRTRWVEASLRRLDLQPRRLSGLALVELLRGTLSPISAAQPIGPADDLVVPAELLAPSGVRERPSAIEIDERWARVIAVIRYPGHLEAGWLGALQELDSDIDISLQLYPSAGSIGMGFLERRIAELSSTVRVAEERGGRADPYRRRALQDAIELQEQIAQGSERLFDVALYLAVWTDEADGLDAATRRIEALFGSRLVHTRRLLYQMRDGIVAALPLGVDPVGVRRVLSTGALAATFPFSGSDLPIGPGLLYGINAASRSPVVLDRFALENHNAVVFATSGAGKSYFVKVELARALQAGHRALVIDPEAEYAGLLGAIGARVVPIGPGAPHGLDPFAFAEATPGALSTRIATVTTLGELLLGELRPRERAAVADAIAFVYARAGFADGDTTSHLVPPTLADVRDRLRAVRGMEPLAAGLDRYVSGAGAWLFRRDTATAPAAGDSVVYTLAGLPEEDRGPAMFLVLDRIWRSLGDQRQATFVVVDEAWWLMRHPDTAAFLFRLVKTARKRHAGLTLVTQDVGDVLQSPDGEAVVANAALQILMKQAPQALPRLAELFRLTRAEQSWLLNARRGEGLLVAQGRRVPFEVVSSEVEAQLITGAR